MTTNSKFLAISGAFLLAGLIAGCATDASNARYMGGGMSSMSGMGAGQMDMQAMMSDHMKTMSPDMRTRMQSMYEMCKAS